ncbi:MAG: PDGLE domain-containing protein [Armatimonadota bacterium]
MLIILSPLGIILPARFNANTTFGEWSPDEVQKMTGHLPSGMEKMSDKWKAPMPDYAFKGQEEAPIAKQSISYIISAALGVAVVVLLSMLVGKAIAKREKSDSP